MSTGPVIQIPSVRGKGIRFSSRSCSPSAPRGILPEGQTAASFVHLETFRARMEEALGAGCCHVLSIRPVGGTVLLP